MLLRLQKVRSRASTGTCGGVPVVIASFNLPGFCLYCPCSCIAVNPCSRTPSHAFAYPHAHLRHIAPPTPMQPCNRMGMSFSCCPARLTACVYQHMMCLYSVASFDVPVPFLHRRPPLCICRHSSSSFRLLSCACRNSHAMQPQLRMHQSTPMPCAHAQDSLMHEFQLLSRLSHPNVVHLYGGCLRPPRVFIVEELMHVSHWLFLWSDPSSFYMPVWRLPAPL